MRPRVKLCGITNLRDALCCAEAGADYLGFIFYRKSARYINPEQARAIIRKLPEKIIPVGVFVNEERTSVNAVIASTGIRLIQLSGDELPGDCENYSVPVWKAFRFSEHEDARHAADYRLDAALLDGAREGEYGGSGRLADMSIARSMKSYHRLVLAGGLSPVNILDAIARVEPFAVDVNSGVELNRGIKDHTKVYELFRQIDLSYEGAVD